MFILNCIQSPVNFQCAMNIPKMFCIYSIAALSSKKSRCYDADPGHGLRNSPAEIVKQIYSKKYHYLCYLLH